MTDLPCLLVTIPGQIKSMANARGSWHGKAAYSAKWRHDTKTLVAEAMQRQGWFGIAATVPKEITFKAYTWNPLDDDNLRSGLKACRDALQDAGIIQNDRPSAGHHFEYQQQTDRRNPLRVAIKIAIRA